MRLSRQMIGADRECSAIRLNGAHQFPGGAQSVAHIVTNIRIFWLQARGAAVGDKRLIIAAEGAQRIAEIAGKCSLTRRLANRLLQQRHGILKPSRLGLEHAEKMERIRMPRLNMQNFLVDHRRLGEAIGAMMRKGGGKGFLDHF